MVNVEALRKAGVAIDRITSYEELDRVCGVFIDGHKGNSYPFLIVLGSQGVGKTTRFLEEEGYRSGSISAVGLYRYGFEHRDEVIIFDECDSIFTDKTIVSLMKSFMNDRPVKTISWMKQNSVLDKDGIPKTYKTSSRLCLLLNVLPKSLGENDRAVLARGKVVVFQPSIYEVHLAVKKWFKDDEIYDFIGQHLAIITSASHRWYKKALEERKTGGNWKEWLLNNWRIEDADPYLPKIAELVTLYPNSAKKQLEEWKKLGKGFSRTQFFRFKDEYLAIQGKTPKIVLPQTVASIGKAALAEPKPAPALPAPKPEATVAPVSEDPKLTLMAEIEAKFGTPHDRLSEWLKHKGHGKFDFVTYSTRLKMTRTDQRA